MLLLLCRFVSDPVQPHRRQPTRLPSPWDSPGKNTGVCWNTDYFRKIPWCITRGRGNKSHNCFPKMLHSLSSRQQVPFWLWRHRELLDQLEWTSNKGWIPGITNLREAAGRRLILRRNLIPNQKRPSVDKVGNWHPGRQKNWLAQG